MKSITIICIIGFYYLTLLGCSTIGGCKKYQDRAFTPLHEAVISGDQNAVERQLANGQDPRSIDKHGMTPMCWAASAGNIPIADVLISHGANVNDGSLAYAIAANQTPMIKYLLLKGSVASGDPLVQAAKDGNVEIVSLLISKGADVNIKGVDVVGNEPGVQDSNFASSTPLAVAVEYGQIDIIKILMANGANPKEKNMFGKTAIDIAQERKRYDIASLLTVSGKNTSSTSKPSE